MNTPFSAFIYDADRIPSIKYQNQFDDENIKLFLRQHFFTNLRWFIPASAAFFLPIVVWIRFQTFEMLSTAFPLLETLGINIVIASTCLWYLTVFFYSFAGFFHWYYNILIVTDRRIVDLTYFPPMNWQITEAQLEEVQDVRYTQGGIWGVLLNFGNIYVQTAGTAQNIMLSKVPNPQRVHDLIIGLLP